mmetsp:Transcript_46523/g.69260  ORF Transcript_46523/g.69260 Transcript_46523/m.69260 type:complete len:209 (-) Transcript_46523:187-813(-)|eukprot:CAMPEP_0194036096 /NCGR_PEP_ID=MMETSP0009_2-20130614/8481_1 /TAXON_ID=210454 /ORGANISM="Grammatophora oceanica, Strain CCMP 410" /LENGTH=208 /DNA_ID=CAMNT_0038677707 /DNA_START=86 /DNA_END=712 /DNA_ORIENTATION=-
MRLLRLQYTALIGSFLLWSTHAAVPTINDQCESAILLEALDASASDGVVIQGSTEEATVDGLNLCGDNFVSSPGVWYLYQAPSSAEVGDDASTVVVQVSTCTDETDFDTALTVYSGYCSSLQCVGGKDDDLECGTGIDVHSTISWHAEVGTRYYILVHGSEANHTGNFGLTTTTAAPATPAGDDSSAIPRFPSFLSLVSGMILASLMQ